MSYEQPPTCAGCRRRIRARSRYYVARCSGERHPSYFHRACIKHDSRCGRCPCDIASLHKHTGVDSTHFIKKLRTRYRNEQLAEALFDDIVSGRASPALPEWLKPVHRAAVRRRIESLNFRGDKWSGDYFRVEPQRMRAILGRLFMP